MNTNRNSKQRRTGILIQDTGPRFFLNIRKETGSWVWVTADLQLPNEYIPKRAHHIVRRLLQAQWAFGGAGVRGLKSFLHGHILHDHLAVQAHSDFAIDELKNCPDSFPPFVA